jgi:hypothetical protein
MDMTTGGAGRYEAIGGNSETAIINRLQGIYQGISRIGAALRNHDQSLVQDLRDTTSAWQLQQDGGAFGRNIFGRLVDEAALQAQAGSMLDEYAQEIVGLAQTQFVGARKAAFRTAAFLEVNSYSVSGPKPEQVESAQDFALSLANAQIGDPVLMIKDGENPGFTAGYLSAPFNLESVTIGRRQHSLWRRVALYAAGSLQRERPNFLHPPEAPLHINLQTGAQEVDGSSAYNRVLVGEAAIQAAVRERLEHGISPESQAELICCLVHTGKTLTDLGYNEDRLFTAKANLRARLNVLIAKQEDSEEVSEYAIERIHHALAIIDKRGR